MEFEVILYASPNIIDVFTIYLSCFIVVILYFGRFDSILDVFY